MNDQIWDSCYHEKMSLQDRYNLGCNEGFQILSLMIKIWEKIVSNDNGEHTKWYDLKVIHFKKFFKLSNMLVTVLKRNKLTKHNKEGQKALKIATNSKLRQDLRNKRKSPSPRYSRTSYTSIGAHESHHRCTGRDVRDVSWHP